MTCVRKAAATLLLLEFSPTAAPRTCSTCFASGVWCLSLAALYPNSWLLCLMLAHPVAILLLILMKPQNALHHPRLFLNTLRRVVYLAFNLLAAPLQRSTLCLGSASSVPWDHILLLVASKATVVLQFKMFNALRVQCRQAAARFPK